MKHLVVLAFFVVSFFIQTVHAQEAEKLYRQKYSRLSFVFQPSMLHPSKAVNTDGSSYPSMDFKRDFSYQFGVNYHVFQYMNWDFNTGLLLKEFTPKFDLNIKDADIGSGMTQHWLTDFDSYRTVILSVPLHANYIEALNPEFNLVFGAGFDVNYIFGDNSDLRTSVTVDNIPVFFGQTTKQHAINLSYDLSVGAQYKTTFALYELSLFLNNSFFRPYVSGIYSFENLNSTPYKSGEYTIKNNFYGISLVMTPKKGWLEKR